MNITKTTHSEEESSAIAAQLASSIKAPAVICLEGDLGAGKSVFARGFLRSLGVTGPIASPTFSLVQLYQAGDTQLAHMDLYRLEDDEEAYAAGIEELIHDSNTICLIEWPQRLSWMLPDEVIKVNISHQGEDQRLLEIHS